MGENERVLTKDALDESVITSENIVGLFHWLYRFRKKIIVIVLLPLVISVAVYFFSDQVLKVITLPLNGQTLFFMTPVDGVMAKIKIALFGGIAIAVPIDMCIITSLFRTKLGKKMEFRIFFGIIPFATVSFAGGVTFAYKLILPTTVDFLISCGSTVLKPMIAGSDYVSFASFFLLAVGLVFELPLVLVALSRIGLIKSKMLMKKRKMAIMITFILLAILTPTPDAFTLLAASMPVLFLYELSVWWIYILEKIDARKGNAI